MGRYISVDLNALRSAKKAILDYSIIRKRYIGEMKNAVADSSSKWQGDDNSAFLLKWDSMSTADGVFKVTENNIDAYTSILSAAYKAYKKAQSESVEQASKIGGW